MTFAARVRVRLYRSLCKIQFVSFPKSGKTWTKRILEAYFTRLLTRPRLSLDLDTWTPFVPVGRWRAVPGIYFNHGTYRYRDGQRLRDWIRRSRGRRVILQTRDPRATMLSYYFQRIRRFKEKGPLAMSFSTMLRDDVYGIAKLVEYLNLWFAERDTFSDFLLLRYEDNTVNPVAEFERLLIFLGVRIDREVLAGVIESVPDTTRNIEEGGFELVERLRHGDDDPGLSTGGWRELGLPTVDSVLSDGDKAYVDEQLALLDPGLGYGPGSGTSAEA
jgi:hypothetical protein